MATMVLQFKIPRLKTKIKHHVKLDLTHWKLDFTHINLELTHVELDLTL